MSHPRLLNGEERKIAFGYLAVGTELSAAYESAPTEPDTGQGRHRDLSRASAGPGSVPIVGLLRKDDIGIHYQQSQVKGLTWIWSWAPSAQCGFLGNAPIIKVKNDSAALVFCTWHGLHALLLCLWDLLNSGLKSLPEAAALQWGQAGTAIGTAVFFLTAMWAAPSQFLYPAWLCYVGPHGELKSFLFLGVSARFCEVHRKAHSGARELFCNSLFCLCSLNVGEWMTLLWVQSSWR